MYLKLGKPSSEILEIKSSFFTDNDIYLENLNKINSIYKNGPSRSRCLICDSNLNHPLFTSHGINYFQCANCGHLNGGFIETSNFTEKIYVDSDYGKTYKEKDYSDFINRAQGIYKPKLDFLIESFDYLNVDYKDLSFLDVGAGSGYFVYVENELGLNTKGIEVSHSQVNFGNSIMNSKILSQIDSKDISNYIMNTERNVISFIGVLEHVSNIHEILDAVFKNTNISYLYISVPLFSFSCIFELLNQNCFSRHLGGAHTHLFTQQSLDYLCKIYKLDIVAKWGFGSDIMDLFRFMLINLEKQCNHKDLIEIFTNKFKPIIDNLQLTIDNTDFYSEVHMLLKKH